MALTYCTIWRVGIVVSTQHKGEPPLYQYLQGRKRCWQTLCFSVPAPVLAGAGQEPLSSCTWRWHPCKSEEIDTER